MQSVLADNLSMTRPRSRNAALAPYPGLVARHGRRGTRYYLDLAGNRIPLGPDLPSALAAWHKLVSGDAGPPIFSRVADAYRAEVLPGKRPATREAYGHHLDRLEEAFGAALLTDIEAQHLAQYYRLRSHKPAALVELAVFSAVWAWAAGEGYVSGPCPRALLRIDHPAPRSRYISDAEFGAIRAAAPEWVQDAMDLALLTAQRPGDLLGWRLSDAQEGHLQVRQGKTGTRLRIAIVGELAALLDAIRARPRRISGGWLVQDAAGQRPSVKRLGSAFQAAAAKAGVADVQFRDLRAKSASDSESLAQAQDRLGHQSAAVTARVYRRGPKVRPLR
jgi:integrase